VSREALLTVVQLSQEDLSHRRSVNQPESGSGARRVDRPMTAEESPRRQRTSSTRVTSATARFALGDLSGGTASWKRVRGSRERPAVGTRVGTGKWYQLLGQGGGIIDTLIELDGSTLRPNGAVVDAEPNPS